MSQRGGAGNGDDGLKKGARPAGRAGAFIICWLAPTTRRHKVQHTAGTAGTAGVAMEIAALPARRDDARGRRRQVVEKMAMQIKCAD